MWGRAVLWLVLLGTMGCSSPDNAVCASGRVCPTGLVCAISGDACGTPAQVEACVGIDPGGGCSIPGIAAGSCVDGVCVVPECGNELVEAGEQCDDGNQIDDDGCSADCRSTERCGDGVIGGSEECDCGDDETTTPLPQGCRVRNNPLVGHCRPDCRVHCGDGQLGLDEACDPLVPLTLDCVAYGWDAGALACRSDCTVDNSACELIGWKLLSLEEDEVVAVEPPLFDIASSFSLSPMWTSQFNCSALANGQVRPGIASDVVARDIDGCSEGTIDGRGFLVGDAGAAYYVRPGSIFRPLDSGTTNDLYGVARRGIDSHRGVAVGAAGTILDLTAELDGAVVSVASPTSQHLRSVDVALGSSPEGDAIAVGDGGTIVRIPVAPGAPLLESSPTAENLVGVWFDADAVGAYAVGDNGTVLRRSSAGWALEDAGVSTRISAVWGRGDEDVFIGLDSGEVRHRGAGGRWRPIHVSGPIASINDLSGYASNRRMVAASGNRTLLFERLGWTDAPIDLGVELTDLEVAPQGTFFAVGAGGSLFRSDGVSWTVVPTAVTARLEAVFAVAEDDVYAVGAGGTVLHYDGNAVTVLPVPAATDLYAVWADASGAVNVGGEDGLVYEFDGAAWMVSTPPSVLAAIHCLWRTANGVLHVGGAATTPGLVIATRSGSSWGWGQNNLVNGGAVVCTDMKRATAVQVWASFRTETQAGGLYLSPSGDFRPMPQTLIYLFGALPGLRSLVVRGDATVLFAGDDGLLAVFDPQPQTTPSPLEESWAPSARIRGRIDGDLVGVAEFEDLTVIAGANGLVETLVRTR